MAPGTSVRIAGSESFKAVASGSSTVKTLPVPSVLVTLTLGGADSLYDGETKASTAGIAGPSFVSAIEAVEHVRH
jgi:hypothetical protein